MAKHLVRLFLLAFLSVAPDVARAFAPRSIAAPLIDARGRKIGAVTLREGPKGVLINLQISGLSSGWHGMHFHQVGDCSGGFKAAGGHVANQHTAHREHAPLHGGLLNPKGNDAGALPNIFIGSDGSAKVELYSTYISLGKAPGRPALLDDDGSALIIHAGPEDQTGATDTVSARIACATFR